MRAPRSSDAAARGPHRAVRDRRGRGLRGPLAPRAVPRTRTRGEQFDELVLDAVEELEVRWAAELAGVEFAVEDVPSTPPTGAPEFDPEIVVDRGVPLGRLLRGGVAGTSAPTILVYRRPIETRARPGDDRADLVFTVVAELAAEYLGRDIDDVGSD